MSKSLKKIYHSFLSLTLLFFLPLTVYAQDDTPPKINGIVIENFVNNVVYKYIFPLAGLICFAFVVKGGYMWMMSSGDPEKVKQAQGTITWSVIGLVIVVVARLLMGVILDAIE